MEVKPDSKKCDICQSRPTCLCYKCMLYFCDSCFKLAHNNDIKKSHKKDKIDYFALLDTKCQEHTSHPIDLFCLNEKGK